MVMPYVRPELQVIDTTLTLAQKKEWLLNLRLSLGPKTFADLVQEAQREALPIEERREAEKKRRLAEAEQKKAIENSPFNQFVHAIKVHHTQPELLEKWKTVPRQTIEEIYAEFVDAAKRRGLILAEEDQNFALGFLNTVLSTSPSPEKPRRWIDRAAHPVKP